MSSNNVNKPTRSDKQGWSIIASGDNGFDLLQFVINVADFNDATRVGAEITALIMQYERPDDVFNTQLTLRDWHVQVQIALPRETWGTLAQQELTDAVVKLYR
ncbi:MAG: hypothetical protein WAZ21_03550 [Candidatus Saccharimonadales bacterium]